MMPDLFAPMPPPEQLRLSSRSWKCREGHDEVGWYGEPVCWFCGANKGEPRSEIRTRRATPYFRR